LTVTTSASCTLGTTSGCNATAYSSGYTFNEEATAATAVTYTLPRPPLKALLRGERLQRQRGEHWNTRTSDRRSGQYVIFTMNSERLRRLL